LVSSKRKQGAQRGKGNDRQRTSECTRESFLSTALKPKPSFTGANIACYCCNHSSLCSWYATCVVCRATGHPRPSSQAFPLTIRPSHEVRFLILPAPGLSAVEEAAKSPSCVCSPASRSNGELTALVY